MNPSSNFGEAMLASLAVSMSTLFAAIPRLLGFIIIVVVGWFLATLIAKAAASLLRAVNFNDLSERAGFTGFMKNMGVDRDASGFIADLAKWFVRLIALVVAFDALGLPAVSEVLQKLLMWLPNLVVALVVLVIAGLAANALGKLVRGATAQAGFTNPDALATVTRVAIWSFAIVVAVNQIGIAAALVNTLLMATFGALALAFGLAFGLGGKEAAAQVISNMKQAAREAKPKIMAAADSVKAETDRESETPALRTVGTVLRHSGPERRLSTGGQYAGIDRRIAA